MFFIHQSSLRNALYFELPVAAVMGTLRRNLILGVTALACTIQGADTKLSDTDLFQTDRLVEVDIEIAAADWERLTAQSRGFAEAFEDPSDNPFTYFPGTVTIDGVRIGSVAIRKKGFIGSLDNVRPSLKIKFDEFIEQDPIAGLDRLTLNNNKQDHSLLSQYLTYQLFNQGGIHAPRVGFAKVTVNGENLGVYSNIESVRKPFLKRTFGDGSGDLYEGTLSDLYPRALDRIEVKRGDEAAIERLEPLANLLVEDGDLDLEKLGTLLDIPHFLRFWAIESLIGFWDGYANNQNNYFMYRVPDEGKIQFIPWGADGAFESGRGMMRMMGDVESTAVYANGMLANRLYWADQMSATYDRTMRSLLDELWNEEKLIAETERIEQLVSGGLHPAQHDASESLSQVRAFIRNRRGQIDRALAAAPGNVPNTPRKPMYSVQVGHANGTFETAWSDRPGSPPAMSGELSLTLWLDDEQVAFKQSGADAGPAGFTGFGMRGGGRGQGNPGASSDQMPVSIRLTGVRASDGETMTLNLTMDRSQYEAAAQSPTDVSGFLELGDGGFGFRRPGGVRSVSGSLKLTAAGAQSGDPVAGQVELTVMETRGGMLGGR